MNDVNELHEPLASVVHADRELADVLTEITGIARRAMPSIEAASVTLIGGEKPFTAAYDGQMALDADELQYDARSSEISSLPRCLKSLASACERARGPDHVGRMKSQQGRA